jgi:DNA-binding transcriptional LysR family regulator
MPDLALDLRYLRYALVVAEHGSFRRAATILNVAQSTVSRRIQLLEHRLGFSLFERDPRGVRLTSAGENFLKEAVVGVNHFDRAVHLATSMHRGERGELHIGILASLTSGFLQGVLRRFREKHEGVKVSIHEASAQENLRRLTSGHLDISFVTGEPVIPGYRTARLWSECVFVALPNDHPLVAKDELTWEEIQRETFIVSSGGPGPKIQDCLIRRLAKLGFRPDIDVHEVGRESLMNLVAIGYGLTLTSTSSLGSEVSGVVFRPIAGNSDVLPSSAVWSSSNTNPALRHLLALAKTFARDQARKGECSGAAKAVAGFALNLLIPLDAFLYGPAQMLGQFL